MLAQKFKKHHIILGSGSPRRQELFKELGVEFTIKVKPINETYPENLKAEEITNYLAVLKATAFEKDICENEIITSSDSIVWLQNKPLEKPKNEVLAKEMLHKLSGKQHQVITSVCIKTLKKIIVFHDVTEVNFKELTFTY